MTTSTSTQTKTFIVRYPVTTYIDVEVTRPSDITEKELLTSIDRNELVNGVEQNDCAWDSLKSSWRDCAPDVILDEDYEEVEFN